VIVPPPLYDVDGVQARCLLHDPARTGGDR
jgi:hypothetical protein